MQEVLKFLMLAKEINSYQWVDNSYNQCFTSDIGFTQLLASEPYVIPASDYKKARDRLAVIHDFQDRCISLFRKALSGSDKELLHWLLNETPTSFGVPYHQGLKEHHYTKPVFFRTDEMSQGKIAEIQCPGSLWGEMELMYQNYLRLGYRIENGSPASEFTRQLRNYLGESPVVHYLVDNASIPVGIRYFIQQTRPDIRYWGIDKNVIAFRKSKKGNEETARIVCNFVRTHSFFGLCGENYFNLRLKEETPNFKYDFPPYVLFDQKAPLALPFWKKTRDYFTDEIRSMIIFSSPICGNIIELEDGPITIDDFSKQSRSKRRYYLKYAGTDVSINWGSRAVERLSNLSSTKCFELLQQCVLEYGRGKIWMIQKEISEEQQVTYVNRSGETKTENLNNKYSFFYGAYDLIGAVITHSKKHIVHGQSDSVVNLIVARSDSTTKNNNLPF